MSALIAENDGSIGLKSGEYGGRNSTRIPLFKFRFSAARMNSNAHLRSIISTMSGDLWMRQLSMTMTELGPGNGFMCSRSVSINSANRAALYEPSTIDANRKPSRERAGKDREPMGMLVSYFAIRLEEEKTHRLPSYEERFANSSLAFDRPSASPVCCSPGRKRFRQRIQVGPEGSRGPCVGGNPPV